MIKLKNNLTKIFFFLVGLISIATKAGAEVGSPDDYGLPTFGTKKNIAFGLGQTNKPNFMGFIVKGISEGIKYVGLLAVISLTIGGIMYMTSYGADDKTKKAKFVIMYSIIGVVVAMSAFALVEIVNNININ